MNNKLSKGEGYLRELIKLRFPYLNVKDVQFNVRPEWLKNVTGENLELDIYIPKFKMAFEFNGEFHLLNIYQRQRDFIKRLLCEKQNIKLYTYSLQTLHLEAVKKGFNKLYPEWFNRLTTTLNDYRRRFKSDRTVNIQELLPDNKITSFTQSQKIRNTPGKVRLNRFVKTSYRKPKSKIQGIAQKFITKK